MEIKNMLSFGTPQHMLTAHGYAVDEVASAVQKCIRRGYEEQALYWSFEMMQSPNKSHHSQLWNRLKVIASEDIGPADPAMPILIDVLFRNWQAKKSECIFTVNAVIALVRSPKSRITDNAFNMLKSEWRLGVIKPLPLEMLDETKLEPVAEPAYDERDVPGFALDRHTRAGKAHGFGKANFYQSGALLNNKAPIRDPYEARAIAGDLEVERRERRD
jgi:replication-associated recombination protein RarA